MTTQQNEKNINESIAQVASRLEEQKINEASPTSEEQEQETTTNEQLWKMLEDFKRAVDEEAGKRLTVKQFVRCLTSPFTIKNMARISEDCFCADPLIDGRDLKSLHCCGVVFHAECLGEWFDRDERCPTCRHSHGNRRQRLTDEELATSMSLHGERLPGDPMDRDEDPMDSDEARMMADEEQRPINNPVDSQAEFAQRIAGDCFCGDPLMDGRDIRVLDCCPDALFHDECLGEWFSRDGRCPYCEPSHDDRRQRMTGEEYVYSMNLNVERLPGDPMDSDEARMMADEEQRPINDPVDSQAEFWSREAENQRRQQLHNEEVDEADYESYFNGDHPDDAYDDYYYEYHWD